MYHLELLVFLTCINLESLLLGGHASMIDQNEGGGFVLGYFREIGKLSTIAQ